jgi:hypothetical protein
MPDDLQYVKLPDGSYGSFPSTMKDEEISAVIQKQSGKVPTGQATGISAQKPLSSRVGEGIMNVVHDPFKAPEELSSITKPIESYTQEGRAAHPVLSRIGDVTRGVKQYAGMVGALSPLLPQTEALAALRAAKMAPEAEAVTALPKIAPRPLTPKAPEIPTVEATPIESTQRLEHIPTVEATPVEPARGLRPIRSPEPTRVDLGEIGPVHRPEVVEPPAAPSPLRPIRPATPETLSSTNLQESGTMGVSSPGLKPIAKPTVEGVVNQAMGLKPLERGTPLREQLSQEAKNELSRPFAEATQTPAEEDPIKIKYPDPAIRKFVRANGEAVVDAAGGDQELLQKIHDLKNVDVREAAINAGIDLGTKHVGSKVALGEEQISRQDLLKQILDKGFKLKKVLDLAKEKAPEEFSGDPIHFISGDYLPEEENRGLFHVTTAKSKVLEEGLKSRAETKAVGLGGGIQNAAPRSVSVTFDAGHAADIEERMNLAVKAARDEITPRQALDQMISSTHLDDTTPEEIGEALGAPEEVRSGEWEDFDKWFDKEYPHGSAYDVVQQLDDAAGKVFSESEYPVRVGFTADKEAMAKIDPNEIATLEVEGRKGAKVQHVHDEAELRFNPKDLRIRSSKK